MSFGLNTVRFAIRGRNHDRRGRVHRCDRSNDSNGYASHRLTCHFTMNGLDQKWFAGLWSFTESLQSKTVVHWMVRVETIETGKMGHRMIIAPWVSKNHIPR